MKEDWLARLGWGSEQLEDIRFVGYYYLRQGKYTIAIAFFEALVALTANKPWAEQQPYDYETLGSLYLETGDYARSLRYLERAARMDPANGRILLNKSKTLLALGRKKEGLLLAHQLFQGKDPILRDRAEGLILGQKIIGITLENAPLSPLEGAVVS